ncbi:hypothetical protein GALL_409580 [mine drainage metagenome]|uniref:Uncharacterized protein n=1 Tax=mine drainage metagenome TaxID=410659 RepID=A0A1J5QBL0_9ZZZZ
MAQHCQLSLKLRSDVIQLVSGQPQGLAQLWRPIRAMQVEDRFTPRAHDMHMRWTMVVGIDDHPVGAKSQDRGHAEV